MFRSFKKSENTITSSLSSGNASIQRPSIIIPPFEHQPSMPVECTDTDYDINEEELIDLQAPPNSGSSGSTTLTPSTDITLEHMSAALAAAVQLTATSSHSKKPPSSFSSGTASIVSTPTVPTMTPRRRFSTRLLFTNPWKKTASSSVHSSVSLDSPSSTFSTPSTPGLEPCSPITPCHSSIDITTDDEENSTVSLGQHHRSRSSSSVTSATASSTHSLFAIASSSPTDDGRDELIYRGIQVKEIKSTLKTLVISDDIRYPMPEVRLERPGFARINY
ncbi:hypothetical protein BDF20DRAFT_843399 [Mycotypha africana]|uniref:uncharacterized protein n=1 Tax=Mycotypha africana TaxID=64632 RepID=UPI002301745E|nr:uncharacterized protein BDF20DRAFT_843399 [Mycotypha africana]KAI8991217.1 hypothetical protein BDF20DRAFT_843399 [Mycotypha africana]